MRPVLRGSALVERRLVLLAAALLLALAGLSAVWPVASMVMWVVVGAGLAAGVGCLVREAGGLGWLRSAAAPGGRGRLRGLFLREVLREVGPEPARYHFRLRTVGLVVLGVVLLSVNLRAGLVWWLLVPDVAVLVVVGLLAWFERVPLGFLLSWRHAAIAAGLGHAFTVPGKDGRSRHRMAVPQVRRLYHGRQTIRVEVLPVLGQTRHLEERVEDLAHLLGMSRGVVLDRRSRWRRTRFVLEFRRPGEIAVQGVELPGPRPALEVEGGHEMSRAGELPAALRVAELPADGGEPDEYGYRRGQRVLADWLKYDGPRDDPDSGYIASVETEYRPDLAPGNWPEFRFRRTGFDHVPERCRPGHVWQESDRKLYGVAACEKYRELPEAERRAIGDSDYASLPCSRCVRRPVKTGLARPEPVGAGTDWRAFLTGVTVGRRVDGLPWRLPVIDTQGLLIVGSSNAGKSGVLWSLNIGLVPALVAGVVELWGLDPKGNELYHGRSFFTEYADDAVAMVELLEESVADMRQRKAVLRSQGVRKFTPSSATPLVVVEVDELLMLQAKVLTDSKLAKRAESALVTLLTQGRSFGFMVVGGIQDPRKEALDMRDLFQVTVGLRMPSPMAELVLSKEAVRNGADTGAIPFGSSGAGMGYVLDLECTGSENAVQVRAAWADDSAITAWEAYLVASRTGTASERYEAAQMAAERISEVEVMPLDQRQTA